MSQMTSLMSSKEHHPRKQSTSLSSDRPTMEPTSNPANQQATPAAFSSATFRFPQPEHYKGERDGFKCEIWLTATR